MKIIRNTLLVLFIAINVSGCSSPGDGSVPSTAFTNEATIIGGVVGIVGEMLFSETPEERAVRKHTTPLRIQNDLTKKIAIVEYNKWLKKKNYFNRYTVALTTKDFAKVYYAEMNKEKAERIKEGSDEVIFTLD